MQACVQACVPPPAGSGLGLSIGTMLQRSKDVFGVDNQVPMPELYSAVASAVATERRKDNEHKVVGLKWKSLGSTKPKGSELSNKKLAKALKSKMEFTQKEWSSFGVKKLHVENFVKSAGSYFGPDDGEHEKVWTHACRHV